MRTYNCLIDIGSEDKKAQDAKKSIIKRKLKFKDYENHLKATQFQNKINLAPHPPKKKSWYRKPMRKWQWIHKKQ